MKKKLLNYLACPDCGAPLKINKTQKTINSEIIEGTLTCSQGHKYTIKNKVPLLSPQNAKKDNQISNIYSKQWQKTTNESEETWPGLDAEQRLTRFMKAFDITSNELTGKTILDAGCGNGILSYKLSKQGAKVVAIDISTSVHTAAQKFTHENLHFIQGDLLHTPLQPHCFDFVWCSGVIHYNPHPQQIFNKIASHVKKTGKLYVWVYMKPSPNLRYQVLWGLVELFQQTPRLLQQIFSKSYIILQTITHPRQWKNNKHEFMQQQQRVIRNFTNPIIHRFTQQEIKSWFKTQDFTNIRIPIKDYETFSGFGICGKK